jgi:hypothetical protein
MTDDGQDDHLWRVVDKLDSMARDHMQWMQNSEIADGSAIDRDDRQFTIMSMRELIDSSLKSALDCLYLACASLLKMEQVRGVGHPALVRSAITAGSTALWLLDDDERTRRTRALQLARIQCLAERTHIEGIPPEWRSEYLTDQFIETRRLREDAVLADAQWLGIAESAVKNKPRDSVIVRGGADRIPDAALAGRPSGPYVLAEWRLLSGWAHGFLWPVRYTSPPDPPVRGQRFESYKVAMSLDRYLGSVKVGFVAARVAMDRYAALGGIESVPLAQPWDMTYFAD